MEDEDRIIEAPAPGLFSSVDETSYLVNNAYGHGHIVAKKQRIEQPNPEHEDKKRRWMVFNTPYHDLFAISLIIVSLVLISLKMDDHDSLDNVRWSFILIIPLVNLIILSVRAYVWIGMPFYPNRKNVTIFSFIDYLCDNMHKQSLSPRVTAFLGLCFSVLTTMVVMISLELDLPNWVPLAAVMCTLAVMIEPGLRQFFCGPAKNMIISLTSLAAFCLLSFILLALLREEDVINVGWGITSIPVWLLFVISGLGPPTKIIFEYCRNNGELNTSLKEACLFFFIIWPVFITGPFFVSYLLFLLEVSHTAHVAWSFVFLPLEVLSFLMYFPVIAVLATS